MKSSWGRVYYSNLLGCLPLPLLAFIQGERLPSEWSTAAVIVVILSLLLSTAISYFAWQTRALLSATGFSVLGNICKVITIVVNVAIWDKHAGLLGIASLGVCLVSSLFYEQAPMRVIKPASPSLDNGMDEEALIAAQDSLMDVEDPGSKEN